MQNLKHKDLIDKMTLEEKASLCSGEGFWHTKAVVRVGIPAIMMTDGPHGLRKQEDEGLNQIHMSKPATCFPPAVTLASSWDKRLAYLMGKAIAEEALAEKIAIVLGPGVNIKRSPLCGRNFEYYSEDPFLAGKLSAEFIKGVQSQGIGTSLKHYLANNQETKRMTVSAEVDERALREIYLRPFEIAVKEAQPATLMCCYNKINGEYGSENKRTLTEILRDEWGFEGFVMTDWGAIHDRVKALCCGLELEMPSSGGINDQKIVQAVQDGTLDVAVLDHAVDLLLTFILQANETLQKDHVYDVAGHDRISRKIAAESAVLLKNEDALLPLNTEEKVLFVGKMAEEIRYQGAGSSHINPHFTTNVLEALSAAEIPFDYVEGYCASPKKSVKLTRAALHAAVGYDKVVIVAGLTDDYEAEGFDRKTLDLPEGQKKLIEAMLQSGKKVIVTLMGGAPVTMPWKEQADAVLMLYLGGQSAGGALVDLLYGDVNPSGKLAETFPLRLEDTPCFENFPGNKDYCNYKESIYVGYRYYNTANMPVLFPFGHGLSYTQFEYSNLQSSKTFDLNEQDSLEVTFDITNIGRLSGAEVAEVYVSDQTGTIFRPESELQGFEKVYLQPGETKSVSITLPRRAFAFYNTKTADWHAPNGLYQILIGASSRDIRLAQEVEIIGEPVQPIPDMTGANWYQKPDPEPIPNEEFEILMGKKLNLHPRVFKKGSFTDDNTFAEMAETSRAARMIIAVVSFAMRKIMKTKKNSSDYVMMRETFTCTPLKNIYFTTQGLIGEKRIRALVMMANGKAVRGFFRLLFNR